MFKKENRLSTNFEFNITRKYGKKYHGGLFYMYILEAKNYTGPAKIGIVVSNRLQKTAVGRNRLKRLYREALRTNLNKFKNGTWIVIQPTTQSLEQSYEKISTDVDQVLSKISLA